LLVRPLGGDDQDHAERGADLMMNWASSPAAHSADPQFQPPSVLVGERLWRHRAKRAAEPGDELLLPPFGDHRRGHPVRRSTSACQSGGRPSASPAGRPCRECGGFECGTPEIPACCGMCTRGREGSGREPVCCREGPFSAPLPLVGCAPRARSGCAPGPGRCPECSSGHSYGGRGFRSCGRGCHKDHRS
jgi:hypothetical protein